MTDNNWITREWIGNLLSRKGYRYYVTNHFFVDIEIAAEINKEIKNILEAAEKRECKDCKHEPYTLKKQECYDCFQERFKRVNWTPKEGK